VLLRCCCAAGLLCAGIIRRAAQHILSNVEAVQAKLKPGESITVRAYALELYNEELRDLSGKVVQHQQQQSTAGGAAAAGGQDAEGGVRIAERPVGKDGRCIPEVCSATAAVVVLGLGQRQYRRKNQLGSSTDTPVLAAVQQWHPNMHACDCKP
jgi:hypothetical protein